jgi:hypothetical protein
MCEIIRLAWGVSSLGDFLLGMSGQGIVAMEFSSNRPSTEAALRFRFPEAEFIYSQEELTDVLHKVERAIKSRILTLPSHSTCGGRLMRSMSGHCCAPYQLAKQRTTAHWRQN